MSVPDSLKPYRLYLAMFVLNLAVVAGVIYLLRRDEPREIVVTVPPTRAAKPAAKSAARITITVSGAVNQPGSYQLDADKTLADALQLAGGVKPEADLSKLVLNLALHDGDKISVPTRATAALATPTPAAAAPSPSATNATLAPTEKINLNTATLEELMSLPRIGKTLAQRILDYRAQHGGFKTTDALKEIQGIGDALFDEIKDKVTLQ